MSFRVKRRATAALVLTCLGATLSACSSAESEAEAPPRRSRKDAGASTTPGGNGNTGAFAPSTEGGSSPEADGCEETTRLVYTIDSGKTLRRFDPESGSFTTVGVINCPSTAGTNSMAVGRDGTAWVLYTDGHLFKVGTKDASCEATSFEPNQGNISTFGMGFASDAADSTSETLFVAAYPPTNKLATIALDTLKLEVVGSLVGANARAELSGTGAGQLFGLFESSSSGGAPGLPSSSPYIVAEVGKTTGQLISKAPQNDVPAQRGNFAFAAWGGDFWLFIGKSVYRYRPSTKETTKVTSVDFNVTGAGVSTCAPHVEVK